MRLSNCSLETVVKPTPGITTLLEFKVFRYCDFVDVVETDELISRSLLSFEFRFNYLNTQKV